MFEELEKINQRPEPFQFYTASDLWTDEHTSEKMLSFHLDDGVDVSSRTGGFIDRSVAWIVSRFKVGEHTKIADFGCGPGLYSSRLARCGAEVTGIDFSKRSIAYAKDTAAREGLTIKYLCKNYLDFDANDHFDLILLIMCDFCALSPAQRSKLLATFQRILRPGGAVIMDVYSFSAFEKKREQASYSFQQLEGFWAPDRYYGFLNVFKYDDVRVSLDKYTIVEPERIREVFNWLQYYSPETLSGELSKAGFSVSEKYSDVAGTPFRGEAEVFGVVAQRPHESISL